MLQLVGGGVTKTSTSCPNCRGNSVQVFPAKTVLYFAASTADTNGRCGWEVEPVGMPVRKMRDLKKHDISCPKCGSVNSVRVAGVYEFPLSPHQWFCHCGSCGNTFNPKKKEDAKNMEPTQDYQVVDQPELKETDPDLTQYSGSEPGGVQQQPPVEPQKTRRERIQELITKEQYVALKEQGLSDIKILDKCGIPRNWVDTFGIMKRGEWGITSMPMMVQKSDNSEHQEPSETKLSEEPTPGTANRLTIAQAIELHDDLEEDKDSIEFILAAFDKSNVSPRVKKLLTWYHDEYQRSLDKVHEVFNTTHVAL